MMLTIGHLKSDHRLNRNNLKGIAGKQANTLLAAAGYSQATRLVLLCLRFMDKTDKKAANRQLWQEHRTSCSYNYPDELLT